jgi:hypothetical protein
VAGVSCVLSRLCVNGLYHEVTRCFCFLLACVQVLITEYRQWTVRATSGTCCVLSFPPLITSHRDEVGCALWVPDKIIPGHGKQEPLVKVTLIYVAQNYVVVCSLCSVLL